MIIIIKNIPENSYIRDLVRYVDPALKRGFIFRSGWISKAEILALRNKITDELEFHRLVHAEPEKVCQLAIQKLRNQRIKNKLLIVKEFFARDVRNDRRNKQSIVPADIMEKRAGDRRRGNQLEVIPEVTAMFKAVSPARKLF